jgi:imidazolonepropionase-like amidohydrolase
LTPGPALVVEGAMLRSKLGYFLLVGPMFVLPGLVWLGCGDDEDETTSVAATSGQGAGPGSGGSAVGGGGGQGGTGGSSYGEITCPDVLTPAASGVCEVSTPGTSGLLIRGTVLGPDALYRGGHVLVAADGSIACVGCECDQEAGAAEASVVDCAEGVISPGLINAHDHITYANNPPYDVGMTRYAHRHEWRTGANGMPEINVNSGATPDEVLFAELRFVMSGATSAASAGGRAGLLRNLDTSSLESLPVQQADSDTFPLDDADGTMLASGCGYGSNATTEADIAGLRGYLPHIAEGISPEAQNEFVCTSDSAVSGGHDLIETQTAVIHAVGLRAADFGAMQSELAAVIWSPRSNVALYGDTARVTLIDALGLPIALGTDWMPSGSMNILRELRCADELNAERFGGHFSDLELWRMVTENAAFATGTHDAIGMLKRGYAADITVFDARVRQDFRAVIGAGVEDVVLVLRGGEALYGDADLLEDAAIGGAGCEDLDVCTVAKKACVAQDVGTTTLAAVRAAGEAHYPLFFCNAETPASEPSCVPWREEYPDGITASDTDGDGIENGADVCPSVFDPIRPLDEGAQADGDGDGIGDACDACPLEDGEGCAAPSADDVDGDGLMNAIDVCPEIADPTQPDADADGHGDGCDACSDNPNPGPAACTFDIATVRDPAAPGHPAVGTAVTVGGFVMAVRPDTGGSRGFIIQDGVGPFQGIFVFTGSQSPGVVVGNEVSVAGVYDEYFDYSEITSPTIRILDAGTTPPFMAITIADPSTLATAATAEPFESMLVSIGQVSIVTMNADDPMDFDELTVTGNLRINDQYFAALDNTCVVGSVFLGLTGVLDYSFGNYKLEPRSGADIQSTTCQPFP